MTPPAVEAAYACFPPLAPQVTAEGTLFRVVSRDTQRILLQLHTTNDDDARTRTITLDAEAHRRGGIWEVFVPGVGPGQLYTWAFRPDQPLLDPYAVALAGPTDFGKGPRPPIRSVVAAPPPRVDWQRPRHPWQESIVYELHVRGFSRHPSSGTRHPGTYRGLAEKADYLKDLGVTAVELLPVHEFDETEVKLGDNLLNFWGYSPVAWFAPNRRYAATATELLGPIQEFREMVLAFHENGIEVIVDVVFNHTAEMGAQGPTLSLRGLDDSLYYLRDPGTGAYTDLSGCGNTINARHPSVRALILHALRWWVHGLGVDGFRFDLAAILAHPSLIRAIEEDPRLEEVHLIAEPWDAAGNYMVGSWPGNDRWALWNDRFRDDVRRAWLKDPHHAGALASRLSGSADLLPHAPQRSLNFVTAHDGFTLSDTVSYARRHNEANGEGGRDGHAHEPSCNHGHEGPTDDPEIHARRERARRNLMATLLLSQGVPMLLGGDELGRTQRGNNNAYCHDSELTWVDWSADRSFHRFVRGLVRLRRDTASLERRAFLTDHDVEWLGSAGGHVDWEADPGHFGYLLAGDPELLVLMNLLDGERSYTLPKGGWSLVANTAAQPPGDFLDPPQPWDEDTYPVAGKSLVLMVLPTTGAAP